VEKMKIKLQIDGKIYEAEPGKNLLEASLAQGLNIPYFCYHPALGSVGACRQCAVIRYKDPSDKKGRIIMSCMEPVADGMIISAFGPEARAFRSTIIENLMLNHPHDCPVCDEGGECHLQDMVVMTGHNYRKNEFKKRTYINQDLGPFINHEMNRCIQCYRCVRFYNDYAGGTDFGVSAAHDHVYFGRFKEGTLESEFSGNLVEVCPTGVFTDKTFQEHFTRKWDLTNTPSICTHCSLGCNIIASERYGSLRRIMNRYNGAVNGYFICDRGRFGYDFVNGDKQVRKPLARISREKIQEEISEDELLSTLKSKFSENRKITGIGSPRASLEANYAMMDLVGKENFFPGISRKEQNLVQSAIHILRDMPVHSPSLKEIEKADAVFVLGEDVTNTAPILALAVRQAARTVPVSAAVNAGIPDWHDAAVRNLTQDLKTPVFIATSFKTKLDELAEKSYIASPREIANLGFAVACMIDGNAPGIAGMDEDLKTLAAQIAGKLKEAENPVIISGIHSGSEEVLHAAANVAKALSTQNKKADLCFVFPESNTMGLGMMDAKSLDDAFEKTQPVNNDILIILENDLYRRKDKAEIDEMIIKYKDVIVLDHTGTKTTVMADLVIPSGSFAETEGTFVNNEGRAQRYYSAFPGENGRKESWRILKEMAGMAGKESADCPLTFDSLVAEMSQAIPDFSKVLESMPGSEFRSMHQKIRRQTPRYSGRTAMNANVGVSEPKPPEDPDSPLAFSMEGGNEIPPSSLVPYYWQPGWNSNQAANFYMDEPDGSLKGGDPGVLLINRKDSDKAQDYFAPGKEIRNPEKGEWLVVPVYKVFGSEELSALSPAVAKRIPEMFLAMNAEDSERAGLKPDARVLLNINSQELICKLVTDNSLPERVAGLSVGLPGMDYFDLPAIATISQSE
jgi:NADH-quinone oxidoreductase subunit G